MLKNIIDITVTPEEEAALKEALDNLKSALSFTIELTPEQRLRMSQLSPRKVDFVEKSLHSAKANPRYMPLYVDMDRFQRDVELRHTLFRLLMQAGDLQKALKETLMTVESQAYKSARIYYQSVKDASKAGEAEAEEIRNLLAQYFKHSTDKPKEDGKQEEGSQQET